jgi:hypothetical protein
MFSLSGFQASAGKRILCLRRRQPFHWIAPAVCVLSLLGSPTVHAQWLDGHNLLRVCAPSGDERVFQPGLCSGYLMGVVDTADGYQRAGLSKKPAFCMPVDVPEAKIKDIVVAYLEGHPKSCDRDAAMLAIEALEKAYPCKK